jgi:hypothetical protein
MPKYVIRLRGDAPTSRSRFWSRIHGWVGYVQATLFTQAERETLSLPVGDCYWEDVS